MAQPKNQTHNISVLLFDLIQFINNLVIQQDEVKSTFWITWNSKPIHQFVVRIGKQFLPPALIPIRTYSQNHFLSTFPLLQHIQE